MDPESSRDAYAILTVLSRQCSVSPIYRWPGALIQGDPPSVGYKGFPVHNLNRSFVHGDPLSGSVDDYESVSRSGDSGDDKSPL